MRWLPVIRSILWHWALEPEMNWIHTYSIDQARVQDGWILAKRERGQYPAPLDRICFVKKGLYGTEKMIFVIVYLRALKRRPVRIQKWWRVLVFFAFPVPYRQRNHRKSRIIFYEKKTFVLRLRLRRNVIAGTKLAFPSGLYPSILAAWVANQSAGFALYCPLSELAIL